MPDEDKKMGGKLKSMNNYHEKLNTLHKEVLKEEAQIDGDGAGSTTLDGQHEHNGENPSGLHSHPEMYQIMMAMKSDIEKLKQPL